MPVLSSKSIWAFLKVESWKLEVLDAIELRTFNFQLKGYYYCFCKLVKEQNKEQKRVMKLPIYAYGHPVLRKETEEIEEDYPNLKGLLDDMFETMYHSKGMGLAAPQIGLSIRVFVIDTLQLDTEERDEVASEFVREAFINPIIIEESGKKWEYEEGCLSIPDVRGNVLRQPQVRIEYYNANFELKDKIFDGITARVIQHEYDHLEGILFTDLLKPLKKRFVKKKLDKIKKGLVEAEYKLIFNR